MMPNPVRLFHITAIDNLSGIFEKGALLSKNDGALNGINYQNIAHTSVQSTRSVKLVPNPPGGNIHDYVPFYFAPRSPMLSAIHNGNVSGCSLRQEDIIHLETTVGKVIEKNTEFVFYDRNATLSYSLSFTDLAMLKTQIAWDLITETPRLDGFCKYFFNNYDKEGYVDRMERRQAEFLVKRQVCLSAIKKIGVANKEKLEVVYKIVENSGLILPVEVKSDWYFWGQ
jgi:ssDNA thymidine ADP-ribosyltransferase, DarT